jgi:hypothetical protein
VSKQTFNLIDENFSHDLYAVAGRNSECIVWDRSLADKSLPIFFSHKKMKMVKGMDLPKEQCYGVIFESQSIDPECYRDVEEYIPYFNKVFTHSSKFLKKYNNCAWIPGGGIWIGGRPGETQAEGNIGIHDKTKLCSMVSSNKTMCDLHVKRVEIIKALKENEQIDTTHAIRPEDNIPPFRYLKNYMFSIVIENYVDELFFTEKILNCFATGTIPVYLGATNIESLFNKNGIIQFADEDDLFSKLHNITPEYYLSKLSAVIENFNICQKYISIEDYIFKNYFC